MELECTLVAAECLLTAAALHATLRLHFARAAADGLKVQGAGHVCCSSVGPGCFSAAHVLLTHSAYHEQFTHT